MSAVYRAQSKGIQTLRAIGQDTACVPETKSSQFMNAQNSLALLSAVMVFHCQLGEAYPDPMLSLTVHVHILYTYDNRQHLTALKANTLHSPGGTCTVEQKPVSKVAGYWTRGPGRGRPLIPLSFWRTGTLGAS